MAMSRSLGWTLLTTRSPIEIVPEVMVSSPASNRSRVDLPQPDGPTSTTNAPSSIGTVTPCRTSNPPTGLRTSLICTDAIHSLPNAEKPSAVRRGRYLTGSYQTFSPMSLDHSRIVSAVPSFRGASVAKPARACEHRTPLRSSSTKTRHVRCGRNNEQADHRAHEPKTALQRM